MAAPLLAAAHPGLTTPGSQTSQEKSGGIPNPGAVLDLESMKPRGTWYEARVPDTLDLAARAELAINGLIGDVDPAHFYGVYQGFKFNANPPAIESGHTGNTSDDALYGLTLTPRNVRTLPMLRAMSGSDFGLKIEFETRVRIPSWLGNLPINATLNGRRIDAPRSERFLVFERLKPGDVIALTFDVPRSTDHYTIDGTKYTVAFRGSTVIDIEPHDHSLHSYPLYMREPMNASTAPMHTVRRFVTDRLIEAQVF